MKKASLYTVGILFIIAIIFVVIRIVKQAPDQSENQDVSQNIHTPKADEIFTNSEQNLGDSRSFGLAIEDIDLDGDNDIFIANYIASARLWINDGEGNFSVNEQIFSTPEEASHNVGIKDLNGDTYPDLFLINNKTSSKVFFNDGDGNFTDSGQKIGSSGDDHGMVALEDIDSDGDIDAFICYFNSPNRLWLNDGNGTFTITNTEYGGNNSTELLITDFNNDTFPDLFLCNRNQPDEVWFNDGLGNFINSGQVIGESKGFDHVDSKDIDLDGDKDLVVANSKYGVKIWLNQNNSGAFKEFGSYFETKARRPTLFDADLDGDFDMITSHFTNGNKLWINDGSGNFTSMGVVFGNSDVISVGFGKLDNNDDFDVVLGVLEDNGGNKLYFNK